MASCLPSGKNRLQSAPLSESDEQNPPVLSSPSFPGQDSFIADGDAKFFKTFSLPGNFSGTLKLKGKNIHNFLLLEENREQKLCLLARFTQGIDHQLLLLALIPQREINLEEKTLEYYYLIQSVNAPGNSQQCSTPALTEQLAQLFPSETSSYLVNTTCPSCSTSIVSDGLDIYHASSGVQMTHNFNVQEIQLQFLSQGHSNPGTFPSCTSDTQCNALGGHYDCCLQGQCVADQALREGVDTTGQGYQNALTSIAQDPAHIFNYPQYFYLCPSGSTSPGDNNPLPTEPPKDRLTILQQLYQCTTPQGGNEEALCTLTYAEASEMITAETPFHTRVDDRDFTKIWSGPASSLPSFSTRGSIAEITYAGKVLYDERHYQCMMEGHECFGGGTCTQDASRCPIEKIPSASSNCKFDPGGGATNLSSNDNLLDTQCVVIKPQFVAIESAPHDRLEITYRVDGSCQRVSSLLARCEKNYVQGQFDPQNMAVGDHSPGTQTFKIPANADTSKLFQVFVDGLQVFEGSHWSRSGYEITFSSQVFDGQRVLISYFVDISEGNDAILTSRDIAAEKINTLCGCHGNLNCSLAPVIDSESDGQEIIDYTCVQPDPPAPDPPLEQTVWLNSKSAPVRYYDTLGKAHDKLTTTTPAQEGRPFRYLEGNPLKPNNLDQYVGFHEIYGTLSNSIPAARPPLMVPVKVGRSYNIFVNSGGFSSCANCGSDYYSALNRLFPNAFGNPGGGYAPDPFRTERARPSGHTNNLRSDDLLFGRACFIPATMIPWSHRSHVDSNLQRRKRQMAQHFFFANGHQRDWYGFDYGSVIGSFDGAHWFSVGHQRQIKARGNKLYLAVNAYFSDLTTGGGYSIRVSEALGTLPGDTIPKTDAQSSGAQCRRYHQCETDRDCITQLGWDYACEDVRGIKTTLPSFDQNGRELPRTSIEVNLMALVGASTGGQGKRCIYRGRGAPCHPNYDLQSSPNDSYTQVGATRINGCSVNHRCATIANESVFNQKIARFAAPPALQNASADVDSALATHTFGLAARVPGRPFLYQGRAPLTPGLQSHFAAGNVVGLCVPGRNLANSSATYINQHSASTTNSGDMVGNIGMTREDNTANPSYLNSCPILDEDGKLFHFRYPTLQLDDSDATKLSSAQNLSSNILETFNDNDIGALISNFTSIVDVPTLQQNRCLRAAGNACFTDLDCGSSYLTRPIFENFDAETDAAGLGTNGYEIKYWQENLICGQRAEKFSANYELKNNVCCRETGKKLTIGSSDPNSLLNSPSGPIKTNEVASIHHALDDQQRNTRSNITYADTQNDSTLFPSLRVAGNDDCPPTQTTGGDCPVSANPHPLQQHNTFAEIAQRSCCTGHWVREFHSDNGGGHTWVPGKMQSVNKRNLACLNYDSSCLDASNASCSVRSISASEGERYNKFFSNLELIGIPQVLIQNNALQYATDGDPITCVAAPNGTTPISETLNNSSDAINGAEFEDGTTDRFYYKASDESNFDPALKQIFSADEINCCLPPGNVVAESTPAASCCSGKIAQLSGSRRCCLEDYTNLTVFFNRYISSMLQDLPENRFDPFTGRPLYSSDVQQMARQKDVCCSGRVDGGKALAELGVPGTPSSTTRVRRFVQGDGTEDNIQNEASLYNLGQRWNSDIYCIP